MRIRGTKGATVVQWYAVALQVSMRLQIIILNK